MDLKTALVIAGLELAEEALEHSRPQMDHYPEPRERHKVALQAVRSALNALYGGDNGQQAAA